MVTAFTWKCPCGIDWRTCGDPDAGQLKFKCRCERPQEVLGTVTELKFRVPSGECWIEIRTGGAENSN
jgi:hypothetical protein